MSEAQNSANPLTGIIQELSGLIITVKDTQEAFSLNSANYTAAVNAGLTGMTGIIGEINSLIDQITVLIAGLKSQITEFEAKQLADPTPRLTAEIEQLREQLRLVEATQTDAAAAMRASIDALNANNAAMTASNDAQNLAALNATISQTTSSLTAIKEKLASLVPPSVGGRRRRRKTATKQRKTRRRKTTRKKTKRTQKGGYRYTKRNQDSDSGRGRGLKRTC